MQEAFIFQRMVFADDFKNMKIECERFEKQCCLKYKADKFCGE